MKPDTVKAILALLLALFFMPANIAAQDTAMVVKHYDAGYSPALRGYLYDVLEAALETTQAEYGPYRIEICEEVLSAARAKLETEKGEMLNVLFTSGWNGDMVDNSKVIAHSFAAFNDLLGLRALIVSPANATKLLDAKQSREAFTELRAGLGFFWEDAVILRHNDTKVVESQAFDALFPMLQKGRFDYLPLSVLEAGVALERKARQYPSLYIYPEINIFYPMNFNLYVNARDTKLSQRIALGLQKAQGGNLQKIFDRYFPDFKIGNGEPKKLFLAVNPMISTHANNQIIDRFLERYGDRYVILK